VRFGGQLVFAESTRLSGAVAERLAQPAVANGGGAVAMILIVPGDAERVERVRACSGLAGLVGISAWNGIAVARLCAADGAALRNDLVNVLAALSVPLPRLWLQ
jgi:urease accessory protein